MSQRSQPVVPVQNAPNRLVSSLFSQKQAGKYCDMALQLGGVELQVHACVVAAFSPLVDGLVSGEVMPPTTPGASGRHRIAVALDDDGSHLACLACASRVVDFMYVGKIQIDDGHLGHVRALSEALRVSELLQICERHASEDKSHGLVVAVGEVPADNAPPHPAAKCQEPSQPERGQGAAGAAGAAAQGNQPEHPAREVGPAGPGGDPLDEYENEWGGLKCPKCDAIFMSLANYQQHCSSHLGKTYTSCYVCNYASIRVSDVIKHLQESDHGERVCSICLLEVSTSQSLKEHIQIHDQPQPFFCLTCSTRFQTRTALNSHIVRHLNETPFVCQECGRGFKWKHGLSSHMVTHSKQKAFLCDQCGYSTAHLRSFIDHKTVHSGTKFKCPEPDCQFSSVRKESVKHHLKTHSKQRPFQCEICGQAFSQSKNLRRHAASHNPSADVEKCPFCSYQTNRSDKFKSHFKRYHKNGEKVDSIIRRRRKLSASSSLCSNSEIESFQSSIDDVNSVIISEKVCMAQTDNLLDEHDKKNISDERFKKCLVQSNAERKNPEFPNFKSGFDKAIPEFTVTFPLSDLSPISAGCREAIESSLLKRGSSNILAAKTGTLESLKVWNVDSLNTVDKSFEVRPVFSKDVGPMQLGSISPTQPVSVDDIRCSETLDVCDKAESTESAYASRQLKTVTIPHQTQDFQNCDGGCTTTSEGIIILNANEASTPVDDAVYVIPDGPFMIMGADFIAADAVAADQSTELVRVLNTQKTSNDKLSESSLDNFNSFSTLEICDVHDLSLSGIPELTNVTV